MKTLILLAALSFSSFCSAGDLLIGQYSHHFADCDTVDCPYITATNHENYVSDTCTGGCISFEGKYREQHPLLGYSNRKYTAFIMTNSFNKTSVVALRNFTYDFNRYMRPAVSVGLATGYSKFYPSFSKGDVTAVGVMSVDIHPANDKFGLVVSVFPSKFISFGLRFKIN